MNLSLFPTSISVVVRNPYRSVAWSIAELSEMPMTEPIEDERIILELPIALSGCGKEALSAMKSAELAAPVPNPLHHLIISDQFNGNRVGSTITQVRYRGFPKTPLTRSNASASRDTQQTCK